MRVKRFVGDSVTSLMDRIKQELGHDAVILQKRQFKEGGFLGLFGQSKIEIVAALEDFPTDRESCKAADENAVGESRLDKLYASRVPGGLGAEQHMGGRALARGAAAALGQTPLSMPKGALSREARGGGPGTNGAGVLTNCSDAGDKLLKSIAQARMNNALEEAAARLQKGRDSAPAVHTGSVAEPNAFTSAAMTALAATPEPAALSDSSAISGNTTAPVFTPASLANLSALTQIKTNPEAITQGLPVVAVTDGEIKDLMNMLREIHHYLNMESGGAGFVPEVLQKWRDYLCGRGVSEGMSRELLFQVQMHIKRERWQEDRCVLDLLEKNILRLCARTQIIDVKALKKKDKPLVMALVGPTGVGKTTTIGKLSAGYSIVESRSVGLITADTYRVAAVEQLRTFGEILGIPVEVVMNATALQEAISKQADKDVIIIDTAGRSPNHVMHMDELDEFMHAARPDLTLLVISATTSPEEQALVLERFRPLSTHLIITKLDESRCEGSLLDLLARTDLPLTYLTNGQNVPDDIDVATPEKLMRWIIGEGVIEDVS